MSDSRILSQYIALNHGPYCPGGRPSRARLGRESCYETTQFRAPLRERFLSGRVNLEMSPKEEKPNSGILESGSEFPPSYRASSVAGGFQEAMDKHRVIYCERSKSDDGILKRSLAFIKRISKRNSHLEVLGSQLDSLALCERNLESRRREFKKLVYGLDDRLSDEQEESEKRDLEASLDSFKYKYPIECSDKELSRARDYLKAPGNRGQVIAVNHRSNIELSIDLVQCLNSQQWLNDELINFYFSMLQERNDRQVAKGLKLKVWLWNSFFYSKLTSDQTNGTGYCYRNVSRWTQRKKIDLFDYDLVLLPINVNNVHWTLGMVDLKLGNIQYFDSLGGSFQDHLGCTKMSAAFFQNMSRYIQDEYMDKKKQKFPGQLKHLTTFSRPVPQQSNGSDCGVFTCMFAECLSEGRPFDFDTTRIDRIREIMLVECIRNEIS
ncbi:ULP1 like chllamydin domain-containing protease [Cryptosporidium canis]|uniref:ULP1 like chllamydin domain-containing protease n=1 Tax=Cryptosporidium canis TaxID=195482 RepID=A0ABQ8P4T7_9CRYT|nr:ULP1 like chllamydin domain-containing protease [Cryptosporidium canis]